MFAALLAVTTIVIAVLSLGGCTWSADSRINGMAECLEEQGYETSVLDERIESAVPPDDVEAYQTAFDDCFESTS